MATQFTLPRQVKINVAGRPYAGAQMFFYQAGTETQQTVYQDAGLTTAHPQPVVADDDGYFPVIWLNQSSTTNYRVRILSATGSLLDDVDDVPRRPFSSSDIGDALDSLTRTSAEIALNIVPVNTAFPPNDPRRHGLSASASGTTNYTALLTTELVARQSGSIVKLPRGTYNYAPAARLDIQADWISDGVTTLRCSTASYTGIFFQQTGSTEIRGLQLLATAKAGTGLRQMPTTTTDFTGYQRLSRVWIIGFSKQVEPGNTFMAVYDNCRFNDGDEGVYCSPPYSGGSSDGYVTTHVYINCEMRGNGRNIYYNSTLQSRSIIFMGGSTELPTTNPATFIRCRGLKFIDFYCEGSPSVTALQLADCSASIEGMYLNDTGGILLGANTEVTMKGVRVTGATNILTGGDGTQIVSMEDCQWPSTGNVISFARFVAINSQINGTWYQFYGPTTGSFTGTLTGVSGTVTGSIGYSINSDIVTLSVPAITGTSGSTAATITGMPAALRPSATRNVSATTTDNGTDKISLWSIATSGEITLYNGTSLTFTGSGTKGVGIAITVTYRL